MKAMIDAVPESVMALSFVRMLANPIQLRKQAHLIVRRNAFGANNLKSAAQAGLLNVR